MYLFTSDFNNSCQKWGLLKDDYQSGDMKVVRVMVSSSRSKD